MHNTRALGGVHPMVIFWLGVLTGAFVISLIFLTRLYSDSYKATILQIPQQKVTVPAKKAPIRKGSAPSSGTRYMPPDGNPTTPNWMPPDGSPTVR